MLIFRPFCDTCSPQQSLKELPDSGANQLPTPQRFATSVFPLNRAIDAGYFVVDVDLAIF